jgi:hypothetical protein
VQFGDFTVRDAVGGVLESGGRVEERFGRLREGEWGYSNRLIDLAKLVGASL